MRPRLGEASGRWVLAATILGSGMALIDSTVVNIALPRIGAALHGGTTGLQWVVNAYTLTLAAFILLGGSLGDRFGRRRVFMTGVVVFACASVLCGAANGIPTLIAARAVQGVGAALLTPGSLAIIQASFAPADRPRAIGAWSGLGGVGAAIGPLVGGWLVEVASWRWIFLINVPLAAVILWISARHVPESRRTGSGTTGFDVTGAVLGAVGLAGATYGLTAWSDGVPARVVLAAGVLVFAAFLLVETRSPHPMMPPGLFRSRVFSAVNGVTFAMYAALSGVFFLLVVQLQVVSGFSPVAAGLSLMPVTVLMLLLSERAGTLANRIGPRPLMTVGPPLGAIGLFALSGVGPDADYLTDVAPGVILLGLGLSATVAPLTSTVLAAAGTNDAGIASGVNNAVARTAGLLSVAVLPVVSGLGPDLTDPTTLAPAFTTSMWICSGLLVAAGVLSATTIPGTQRAGPSRPHCALASPPLHETTD